MNKKIIVFDLDGTLADIRHRRHFVEKPDIGYPNPSPDIGMSPDESWGYAKSGGYRLYSNISAWKPDWDAFHKACVDDKPNSVIIGIFRAVAYRHKGNTANAAKIEIWSGRDEIVRPETQLWLRNNNISYSTLRMRPHGDHCPDTELKKRWLDEVGKENVLMVFDDRDRLVKMWRNEGITCLQVAEGSF